MGSWVATVIESLSFPGKNCSGGEKVQRMAIGGDYCDLEVKMLSLKGQGTNWAIKWMCTESTKSPSPQNDLINQAFNKCEDVTRLLDNKRESD